MSLLKVIDADDDVICYLDISETFCPDDELDLLLDAVILLCKKWWDGKKVKESA